MRYFFYGLGTTQLIVGFIAVLIDKDYISSFLIAIVSILIGIALRLEEKR